MKKILLLFLAFASVNAFSQTSLTASAGTETEIIVNPIIKGTLFSPADTGKATKLVILVAGSGPTDRYGNQRGLNNNSLKYLADEMVKNGTAVFSYDKRGISADPAKKIDESTLSFDDFIGDAKDVIAYFKDKKTYSKIIVAGHSEGSLIGMIAARGNADGFISIAGAGRNIGDIIVEQITAQMPAMKEETQKYVTLLKSGQSFKLENPMLASLFRESVQPLWISWMKYEPALEIKKLKIPALIINGTNDLQVQVRDAELLKNAKPDATLAIIPGMNHVFKEIKGDRSENLASYSNPDLPISKGLSDAVNQFIKTI